MQSDHIAPAADAGTSRETMKTIAAAIADGHVDRAKAIYQQATGQGPAEADTFVAQLTEKLKAKYPERFAPRTPAPTVVAESTTSASMLDRIRPWQWIAGGVTAAVAVIGIATVIILKNADQPRASTDNNSAAIAQQQAEAEQAAKEQRERAKLEAARIESERKAAEERQAAQREREAQEQKERDERTRLASVPVDLSWDRLPAGFKGHDPRMIYDALSKRLLGIRYKDRFETEAQHKQKITDALKGPIIGSLDINSRYAFMVKDSISYDAEKSEFRRVFTEWRNCDLATLDFKQGDSYIGENAFGVKKEIDVYTSEVLELSPGGTNSFEKVTFAMPAAAAREAEQQIRFLLIGTLQPPYLDTDRKEHTPTIDSPRKSTRITHTIPLAVEEIWVIRIDTGGIIRRIKPWVPQPDESIQRAAKELEDSSRYENVKATVRKGNPTTATLTFTKTYDGTYSLSYQWDGSQWVLKGGIFNKRNYDDTTKRITLRAEYGFSDDEEVPWDVHSAFSGVYAPPK